MSAAGTMPPITTGVSRPRLAQRLDRGRAEREVGAGVHREPDAVDVLLQGGGGHRVGGLAQPGVDDLEPGVAEERGSRPSRHGRGRRGRPWPRARADRPAVGGRGAGHTIVDSIHVPNSSCRAAMISPSVA